MTFSVETAGVKDYLRITPTEVTFNDTGADVDFRIEGDTNANLFKVDAGNDRIGIGTSSPSFPLGYSIFTNANSGSFSTSLAMGSGANADLCFAFTKFRYRKL